jgi:EAL domain-containing protein (putative c-di-GMP-specific phosphodiesterase class I)
MVGYLSELKAADARAPRSYAAIDGPTMVPGPLRDRLISLLRDRELEIVYQPAIRLDAPRVEFFEALARFRSGESPDRWFAAAADADFGTELEMLAARSAIEGLNTLPEGSSISINMSPSTILSSMFAEEFTSAPLECIILEITENEAVEWYEPIVNVLSPLRERGLRVAVDDVGAGYSSFRHILQIRPDIIKLDISICRDIHTDDARRALTSALITFARQIGSELVAEGVENTLELNSLRALGMSIVQGYIFARPMSLDRISGVQRPKKDFELVIPLEQAA